MMTPLMESGVDPTQALLSLDQATLDAMTQATTPVMGFYVVVFLLLAAPTFYRMRFADQILMDDPKVGALGAVRLSGQLLYRKRLEMLKLDLRIWWYYAAQALALGLCNTSLILGMVGISVSTTVDYVCYGAYLVLEFVLCAFLRNRVEAAVAVAYETLTRPRNETENPDFQ
jgi:hypothetical protein